MSSVGKRNGRAVKKFQRGMGDGTYKECIRGRLLKGVNIIA